MKNITFLLTIIVSVWSASANAFDKPETSKDGKVKWYFLQTRGNGSDGRYWTAVGDFVYARDKADFTDYETMAKQLWCFESEDGEWYTITNRYDGRRLGVGYGTHGESLMLHDTVQAKFLLRDVNGYLGFKSDTPVAEGNSIFIFPAVGGASYDFVVWLIRESASNGTSSGVIFEEYADVYFPQNSDTVTWYNIITAEEGSNGEMITDNTSAVDTKYKFTVEKKETTDQNAQWRFVETTPGKTSIINRATGNSISTNLSADGRYNIPLADAKTVAATTWNFFPVSDTQYAVASTSSDGVQRLLNAQTLNEDLNVLTEGSLAGTNFAWTFSQADTQVGIEDVSNRHTTSVKVIDGRVVVPEGANVTIITPDGITRPTDTRLTNGVYIVTIDGYTTKILVH